MQGSVYILIGVGVIFFAVIFALTQFQNNYSLDSIKSKKVGDGQYGTASFANQKEIESTYKRVPYEVEKWRRGEDRPEYQGMVLGAEYIGKKIYALVDTEDVHCLMIGAAGIGKTANFLYPNMEYALAAGMSILTTDTKGDLYRNYAGIAKKYYGYESVVIDLRNPTKSDGDNMLHLVNEYMDKYLKDETDLMSKAKAETYAKLIANTIIFRGTDPSAMGQNSFFYESAEGLLTAAILLVAEFCKPEERHIISVFKLIQDLLEPSKVKGKNQFQILMNHLPDEHKARWFAGAALNSAEQAMMSVISTTMSRLNAFLDSELEQILCFDTAIDAERFCNSKTVIFLVLPEEDNTKYFLISLIIQQLYGEILKVADANDGKLKNRAVFMLDEVGTLPRIQSIENMFSAIRSRRVSIMPVIQSFAQLKRNYGDEGMQIIVDNCQDMIFSGFAPMAEAAKILSDALGNQTVTSGSVTQGKDNQSKALQMIQRALMTPDELKTLPRGHFVVMKASKNPMKTRLKLFFEWGITFEEPYRLPEKAARKVVYADKNSVEEAIIRKYQSCVGEEVKSVYSDGAGGESMTEENEPIVMEIEMKFDEGKEFKRAF